MMFLIRLKLILRLAGRELAVLWYAWRHPAAPLALKLGVVLLGAYLVSPIDLIPDTVPLLGWLDDATLLAFAVPFLLKLVPSPALRDARLASDRLWSRWMFWRR